MASFVTNNTNKGGAAAAATTTTTSTTTTSTGPSSAAATPTIGDGAAAAADAATTTTSTCDHPISLAVKNEVSGIEVLFLDEIDPTTTTIAHVKARIHEKYPTMPVADMRLSLQAPRHRALGIGTNNVPADSAPS